MIIPQNIIKQLLKYIIILVVQLTFIQCHIVHIGNITAHIITIYAKIKLNVFIFYFDLIYNSTNNNTYITRNSKNT